MPPTHYNQQHYSQTHSATPIPQFRHYQITFPTHPKYLFHTIPCPTYGLNLYLTPAQIWLPRPVWAIIQTMVPIWTTQLEHCFGHFQSRITPYLITHHNVNRGFGTPKYTFFQQIDSWWSILSSVIIFSPHIPAFPIPVALWSGLWESVVDLKHIVVC